MLKILTSWKQCTKDSRRMQLYESMRISRNIWKVTGSAVVNELSASEIKPYLEETIPIIMQSLALGY